MTVQTDVAMTESQPDRESDWWVRLARTGTRSWLRIAIAVGGVALLTGVMYPLRDSLGVLNVLLLYLILSLVLGLLVGVRAAAIGAVLAFIAYDFFFIPPVSHHDCCRYRPCAWPVRLPGGGDRCSISDVPTASADRCRDQGVAAHQPPL